MYSLYTFIDFFWNSRSSAGMMYGMMSYSICVREYLVFLSEFIFFDGLLCVITCGGLFILIFFTHGDGMVCSIFISSILRGSVYTLGGHVSNLRGGVVCSFIGSFYFYFGGEKTSANLYNASILVSPTL